MLVCGIELTGNEANICLLKYNTGAFSVLECRARLFTLPKLAETDAIRHFHFSFNKLMEDYKVDEVAIIERPLKGKLAGSANSFKLETAIQLIPIPVTLINASTIKEQTKRNPMPAGFDELGLKKFQKQALLVAYTHHCVGLYTDEE